MIRKAVRAAAAVLVFAAAACSDDPEGPGSTTTVNMQAAAFSPSAVNIDVGETVRWNNQTATAHNITPDNPGQAGVWAAANIAATVGANFSHTFNTAGTFNYRCTIHAGMTGSVTVD